MKNLYGLLFLITIILLSGCKQKSYLKTEGLIWNTAYHIIYESEINLEDSISKTLDQVGQSLSFFDENSLLSKLNRNETTEVDSLFIIVYRKSKEIYQKSEGAFDPTVSPLISAWGFGKGHTATSDTAKIDSIQQFIGLGKTNLREKIFTKEDLRIQLNFSAIAKGFGCDCVAEMFKKNGVENFMIEIGGEIVINGKSPRGDKWNISIDAPVYSNYNLINESYKIISLTDCGIATSGNYRNYHESKEGKFGHTISPVTGKPVQTDVISATIIASDCMTADAIATACMVLGSTKALKLISDTSTEGMIILPDTMLLSPGFGKYINE